MQFISGEKIQFLCDHFIGTVKDFTSNRQKLGKHLGQQEKIIKLGELTSTFNNKPLIYCYTQSLKNLTLLIETLRHMENNFNLIFHNSDDGFTKTSLILFDKLPLLNKIFTQNMNIVHPRVFPLPIGFANSMWSHGNPVIYDSVYSLDVPKTKNIYFYFNIHTAKQKRQLCYNEVVKNPTIIWNQKRSYRKYLIELKSHKYAVSPEGNGLDCHRFWECLYMGVIPICKKNILVDYYKQFFPIIVLDDWSDLDPALLEKQYLTPSINKNRLDLSYIKEFISLVK
tara:strand:+ start:200 stop:1048 length:849 start_codon:yes stop_codon:yes gene_type:complete